MLIFARFQVIDENHKASVVRRLMEREKADIEEVQNGDNNKSV